MFRPPLDPRQRTPSIRASWQGLLVSYAIVFAVLLLLWVIADPLPRTVFLAGIASLYIGARRTYGLIRCFYDCGGFVLDLGDRVQITVRQLPNR